MTRFTALGMAYGERTSIHGMSPPIDPYTPGMPSSDGTRCITVHVNESDLEALAARSYLPEEASCEPAAIKATIESVISDLVFELECDRDGKGDIS